ncbi:MAG: cysteine hydrolase [Methanosarcinaceae archaeon]|nr:cysteine hydrolase [Methanosarcinaceae archaeon]
MITRVMRNNTALIIVDAQNFILHEKGLSANWGVLKHAKEKNMIKNTVKAIEKARASSIPIIYIRMDIRPQILPDIGFWKEIKEIDFTEITPEEGDFQMGVIDELTPHPEDFIVNKYHTMDSFYNTDLDQILRSLKCDTLLFAGAVTNLCVESTARGAFDRGYRFVVLSDCIASMNEEVQRFSLDFVFPMLGEVCTSEQLEIL